MKSIEFHSFMFDIEVGMISKKFGSIKPLLLSGIDEFFEILHHLFWF